MNDADRRVILREHGHEVTNRGKLRPELRELADAIASGAEPGSPPPEDEAEYDAGVTAADFGDLDDDSPAPAGEDEPAVPLPPERKPRAVKATAAPLRSRLLGGRKKPAAG